MELPFALYEPPEEDEARKALKELCALMVDKAYNQDDLLSCPHTWSYDDERGGDSDRVLGRDK